MIFFHKYFLCSVFKKSQNLSNIWCTKPKSDNEKKNNCSKNNNIVSEWTWFKSQSHTEGKEIYIRTGNKHKNHVNFNEIRKKNKVKPNVFILSSDSFVYSYNFSLFQSTAAHHIFLAMGFIIYVTKSIVYNSIFNACAWQISRAFQSKADSLSFWCEKIRENKNKHTHTHTLIFIEKWNDNKIKSVSISWYAERKYCLSRYHFERVSCFCSSAFYACMLSATISYAS